MPVHQPNHLPIPPWHRRTSATRKVHLFTCTNDTRDPGMAVALISNKYKCDRRISVFLCPCPFRNRKTWPPLTVATLCLLLGAQVIDADACSKHVINGGREKYGRVSCRAPFAVLTQGPDPNRLEVREEGREWLGFVLRPAGTTSGCFRRTKLLLFFFS